MVQELDLDELRATYDHPADKSVIELIDRLEQVEQAVQRVREVLKTGAFEVRDFVIYQAVPVEFIEEALDGDGRE